MPPARTDRGDPRERTPLPGADASLIGDLESIAEVARLVFQAEASGVGQYVEGRVDWLAFCGVPCADEGRMRGVARSLLPVTADGVAPFGVEAARTVTIDEHLYVAAPLVARDGRAVGLLIVREPRPRADPSKPLLSALQHAARLASSRLDQWADLRLARREFDDVFENTPKPLWLYDPLTLRFLHVNQAAIDVYGHSRAAFMGMTVLDIRPASEQDRMIAAVRSRSDLEDLSLWRHMKADGSEFDVVTSGRPMRFRGVDAVLAFALDRSDVQSLRKDLNETRALLDTIIEALPIGVFVKDMQDDGRYVLYNAAAGEVVGRVAGAVVGATDQEVFEPETAAGFRSQDRAVMDGGLHTRIFEEQIRRPSGERLQIRTIKKPMPSIDGSEPRYLLGINEDITHRRRSEEQLEYMASHDALTALPNRLAFRQQLDERLASCANRPSEGLLSLLYVDLDFFKVINDTYGHPVGDDLLVKVAGRLRSCVQRTDLVARLGGDEFAILTRTRSGDEALAIAERIRSALVLPIDLGECVAHIDASIGIAIASGPGPSGDALTRLADIALYAAKAEGRGLAKLYSPRMSWKVETRQTVSEELRLALSSEQLELRYQPLFDRRIKRIVGFEALLYWRHPIRGLIAATEFLPVAEQTGLIVPIGEWMVGEACRAAATWPASMRLATRMSAEHFKKGGVRTMLERALAETGLPPERLELQVAESLLVFGGGLNVQALHAVRGSDVRIALDDFGAGPSSLHHLRVFPFDRVKLHRSLVQDVCLDEGSLAVIRAIAGLCASLAIRTSVTGIETAEQFAKLQGEAVDEVQGPLIGGPLTAQTAQRLATADPSRSETLAGRDRPNAERPAFV